MKRNFAGKRKSFASKLSRMLCLGTMSVLIFVFLLNGLRSKKNILHELIETNAARVEIFGNQIETDVNSVERYITGHESSFRDNLDDREKCRSLISEVAANCNVSEAFFALEPTNNDRFMLDALREEDGSVTLLERPDDFRYHLYQYYLLPKRLKKDIWTYPYLTTLMPRRVVTYSHPILDEDKNVLAVIGADILLESLTDSLNAIVAKHSPMKGSSLMVISEDGRYISHPDKSKIANETYITDARENGSPDLEILVDNLLKGEEGEDIIELYGRKTLVAYSKMDRIGWGIILATPFELLNKIMLKAFLRSVLLMLLGLIIVGLLIHQIIWFISRPILKYTDASSKIAGGDFDTPVEKTDTGDELQELGESLDNMRSSLKKYMQEIILSTAHRESMEKELSIAHDIQMSMLPVAVAVSKLPPEIDIFGFQQPAKDVGGDLYYYMVKGDTLSFIIGDVSGKGVPASLVMAQTVCLFKAQKENETPLEIVSMINSLLSDNNGQNMFVTLIVGKLDLSTGNLSFCNAGHEPMLLLRDGKVKEIAMERNMPVGLWGEFEYKMNSFQLESGDKIVLYTDGIAEADNMENQLYSIPRLKAELQNCQGLSAEATVTNVIGSVREFENGTPQSDDITIMCLHYKKLKAVERTIVFKNRMSEIKRISAFIEVLCEEISSDCACLNEIQLAVEEAAVNVINYAYPEGSECDSTLAASYDGSVLTLELSDSGVQFDPTLRKDPDVTAGIQERPVGGLGIFLIKNMMDEVVYQYKDQHNVLTMTKKIS
ncbi:MAG: SpoIIE family protein phosphatase [Bacteroidales bacterium]|nr:SpoIIE family protein phosphatase [Bacteroidales bacterium]